MGRRINYKQLVIEAIKALDSFYGGDSKSKYTYASAVLTNKGNIYTASNSCSDTASLTLHAEQSALSHAAAHKDAKIVAIATVGKEDPKGMKIYQPCGICKQLIWENSLKSGTSIKVVMANLKGSMLSKTLEK